MSKKRVDLNSFKKFSPPSIILSNSPTSKTARLADLSYSIADGDEVLYLVVPDSRENDVRLQLSRPAIKINNIPIKYIVFSELSQHCDALCKFGDSHKVMEKIAKTV